MSTCGGEATIVGFSDEVNVGPRFLALRKGLEGSDYVDQPRARPQVLERARGEPVH